MSYLAEQINEQFEKLFAAWRLEHPTLYAEFERQLGKEIFRELCRGWFLKGAITMKEKDR